MRACACTSCSCSISTAAAAATISILRLTIIVTTMEPDQSQTLQDQIPQEPPPPPPPTTANIPPLQVPLPSKPRLQDLVNEVDPDEQLDEDVEEVLLEIADEFIEDLVSSACSIAKHRGSNTLDVDDVKLHLERKYNIWVPGFGENKPMKRFSSEAHRQRMALINKKDVRSGDKNES